MNLLLNNNYFTRIAYTCSFLALMMIGGCVMAADIDLNWEWPAKRSIEDRLLVKIDGVEKQGSGLFGIKKSPSLAGSLPDPYVVHGIIENGDDKLHGKSVMLVAPKLEIGDVSKGSYVVFGVVNSTTCICVVPVANKDVDLKSISCPQ